MTARPNVPVSPKSRLQNQCDRLSRLAAVASIVLAGLMILETLGPWLVKPLVLPNLLLSVASLVAPTTYILGLWRLGRVLKAFAREGRFVAAAFEALGGVGLVLVLGAVFTIVIEPQLAILLGRSRGYLIGLSAADIALGLLGALLWGFGRLFRRAARLEDELDGFI
jgi:hypothetical protein